MNPQQARPAVSRDTCDLRSCVLLAQLHPKSSGPLSQPTEPVSCNLRSLVEPGWEGEGLLFFSSS